MRCLFPACLLLLLPLFYACEERSGNTSDPTPKANTHPIAAAFDFPVGPPHGEAYYNAQPFGENEHLGDDWNGLGGGNTDLGDTIYAIAAGVVSVSKHYRRGWGNIIRITHMLPDSSMIESLYAHCDERFVSAGDTLSRGTPIGTIGNADGQYYAHLHFEIRSRPGMDLGAGYGSDTAGYLDPTAFINAHRGR